MGAEISYIFGFTNTPLTENLLCGSAFADIDIVLIVAAGAAIGCGTLQQLFDIESNRGRS